MASRIAKTPLLQIQRQLAAQAIPAIKKSGPVEGLEVSTLSNGLTVASLNAPASAVTTLGVVVKAGSRFESYDNLGVTHLLRIAAGLATKNSSSLAVVRNLQQAGAGLNCAQSREFLTYTTQMTRDKVDSNVDFFLDTIAQPAFKPWELSDNAVRLALDVAELSNEAKAIELLHQAAYRSGLGNSLYAPAHMIGKHKPAVVEAFHAKHFVGPRAVIVGVGVEHTHLVQYGELLKFAKGSDSNAKGKYYGGEIRHETGGKQAVVVIAAETSGLANPREAVAARLLQKILGDAVKVPYGKGTGQLQKAVADRVGDAAVAVSGINYGYADSGLIGAFIIAEAGEAGKAVEAVAAKLRSVTVTDADLKAAKKALSIDVNEGALNAVEAATEIGMSTLIQSQPLTDNLVSQATLADVQAVAKKLSSKWTMSAIGNLSTVPYLDAL